MNGLHLQEERWDDYSPSLAIFMIEFLNSENSIIPNKGNNSGQSPGGQANPLLWHISSKILPGE
jgi:hypothetical protein